MPNQIQATAEVCKIREFVLQHGWNSTCFQVVNPGIEHWWSPAEDALVGFVRSGRFAVVAGAPICAEPDLPAAVQSWEAFIAKQELIPCYFGAEERLRRSLAGKGYREVILGCQPEWHPAIFVHELESCPGLRAQVSRSRNKGVVVEEWEPDQSQRNAELEQVLADWLSHRGLPTMRFLVEPDTLGNVEGRRIFVARREGRVVGFTTLCPVPQRSGWLTEQFVRASNAPNGTIELLLYHAAKAVADEGAQYLTMGIVPLLTREHHQSISDPPWLRPLRSFAERHYTRFYNFRGLFEFKAKFNPERWTPVVVMVKGDEFKFGHLRSLAKAFTVSAPEWAVICGIGRAIRVEFERLRRRP